MGYIIGIAELAAIVNSLKSPIRSNRPLSAERRLSKAVENRFVDVSEIEDIFYEADQRLDAIRHAVPVTRWCEVFSIPVCNFYQRPRRKHSSAYGYTGVSVEGLASLLITIESMGYLINPHLLVTRLFSALVDRGFISDAELNILWYEKTRYKTCVTFTIKRDEMGRGWRMEKFRTAKGYKVDVTWNEEGRPIQLTVKGPKYRARPAPVLTECKVCGHKWYRGDADSSAGHRSTHARRLKYLDPKPDKRLRSVKHEHDGLFRITANSPQWMHGAIYLRALAFKREFRYDFIQWGSPKGDADPNVRGYLFANSDYTAVGACAFRWRDQEGKSFWGLQWMWIAPKYRRSGVLTKCWKKLRQLHGDFYIEPPVSDAMVAFVKKNGDQNLLAVENLSEQGERLPVVPLVAE